MRLRPSMLIAYIMAISTALAYATFLIAQFIPIAVIENQFDYLPMEKKIYHEGEVIEYQVDFCKLIDAEGEMNFQLINGRSVLLGSLKSSIPKGCYKFTANTISLPKGIHKGTYRLLITTTYKVWGLRSITYPIFTEPFEVI